MNKLIESIIKDVKKSKLSGLNKAIVYAILSRHEATSQVDIVGELKNIVKYVGKKSSDPWDNGYATCAHEVEEIIRKYEEAK